MFEIGTSLREARVRQGVDLLEAERATKIRSKYLRALEDERFELLPAQTYVKGFLRSYAEYLGLDGQLYVDEYNSRYVADEDALPRVRRTRQSPAHRRVESGVLLITLAGIAVMAALVIVAWKYSGDKAAEQPSHVPLTQQQQPPAGTPTHVSKPWNRLDVTAKRGNSRITVYRRECGGLHGILLYEGTLEKGQTKWWAGRTMCIQATRPANLDVLVNGRTDQFPGNGRRPIVAVVNAEGIERAKTD
jgi:helix-turn-helix protein